MKLSILLELVLYMHVNCLKLHYYFNFSRQYHINFMCNYM